MSFAAMPALMLAVAAGAPERYADVLEAYRAGDATAVERVGQVPEKVILAPQVFAGFHRVQQPGPCCSRAASPGRAQRPAPSSAWPGL
jgi:hypothetical protein